MSKRRVGWLTCFVVALALASLCLGSGCQRQKPAAAPRGPAAQANKQGGLFEAAAENLDRLEDFDTNQMLTQICDRLNQWYQQEKPTVNWQRDPLADTLPEKLRASSAINDLSVMLFNVKTDSWFLQESVWMRNISKIARADQFEALPVAELLFDWTVRNIQLDPESQATTANRHRPYEVLLFGRGTALDRDWVFMLLARQQGLDVVLLGIADQKGESVRPWATALLSDGELYLFDSRLGLPIPGPGGQGVATLSQAVADESILRQLDLDDTHRYEVTAADLKRVVALVEASPSSLSRRMALVESHLTGRHKLVLTSPGSVLVDRLKKLPTIQDARLWTWPFELTLARERISPEEFKLAQIETTVFQAVPTLGAGRSMYFSGKYDGHTGAKRRLLDARPADEAIENFRLPPQDAAQFTRESISAREAAQIVMARHGKQNASFWLGLIAYEQQDYASAIDWFAKRTLEATPNGPWTNSARYNLARAHEASGQFDEAIKILESDKSTQSHGNKLRARRLARDHRPAKAESADSSAN